MTSVQESAAGDGGGYDVSLAYGAFVQTVTTTNANGSSSPQITGWVFTTSRAIAGLANVAAPGSSPNADIPTPAHYYMLVDGMNGGSTAEGHVGWFDLGSFSTAFSNTNAQTAGKPTGQDVAVTLAGPGPGDSALLTELFDGRAIRGVRIEGVANDRDGQLATVYKLDLVTAHVTAELDQRGERRRRRAQPEHRLQRLCALHLSPNPNTGQISSSPSPSPTTSSRAWPTASTRPPSRQAPAGQRPAIRPNNIT